MISVLREPDCALPESPNNVDMLNVFWAMHALFCYELFLQRMIVLGVSHVLLQVRLTVTCGCSIAKYELE